MKSGVILLLTDRPDRSESLRKVVDHVADCRIVTVSETCIPTSDVVGFIVYANLSCHRSRAWLRDLLRRIKPEITPALFLTASMSPAALHEAKQYGARLCLPSYSEPKEVIAALARQIWPDESLTDIKVQRSSARAGQFFRYLFSNNAKHKIDIKQVESTVDPVLDAIRTGGIARWLDTIWAYDDSTFQHCMLVAGLVAAFSHGLGFSAADQRCMVRGALVHDVGKTKIPKEILNKTSRLDADEIILMRTHAAIGHQILIDSEERDQIILNMTRHHHELLDGSGYPDSLSGKSVADPVRLLTICDIYAALIERRPYKPPYSSEEAMRVLCGMQGKLELGLVQAFGAVVAKTN